MDLRGTPSIRGRKRANMELRPQMPAPVPARPLVRYDVDEGKTRVGHGASTSPFLLVAYKHEDGRDDTEVLHPDEIDSRLRLSAECVVRDMGEGGSAVAASHGDAPCALTHASCAASSPCVWIQTRLL